ncbi:MAG: glycosyltransferase family 2 protein [Terriglobales bacterium]
MSSPPSNTSGHPSLQASVIIPSWGRGRLLAKTLAALAAQPQPETFEVLVVENGSREALPLQEVYPNFRFFWLESRGVSAARNLGIRNARASLLIFLDDDVTTAAGFVAAHVRAHQGATKQVIIGDLRFVVDEQCACSGISIQAQEAGGAAEKLRGARHECGVLDFPAGNFSIESQLLMDVGGFDESFDPHGGLEELDLALRLQEAGARFFFDPGPVGTHIGMGTESYYYDKLKLTGRNQVQMLMKYGPHAPHVRSAFLVRGYTVPRAVWGRRVLQHAPFLFDAISSLSRVAAKAPGLRHSRLASLDHRLKQFRAFWSGACEVMGWQELERTICEH